MDRILAWLTLAVSVLAGGRCLANDTLAVLTTGGLVFEKAEGISMQREDLFLSPTDVRVRYEIRNDRGAPFEGRVAFPLPELSGDYNRVPTEIPFGREINFVGFQVKVDGKSVESEAQIRAVENGQDVTDQVRSAGFEVRAEIPPDAFDSRTIVPEIKDRLIATHLVDFEAQPARVYERSKPGTVHDMWPLWSIQVTYHWRQTFRPGLTVIEHHYVPAVGGWYFADSAFISDEQRSTYCIDSATERAVKKLVANSHPQSGLSVTVWAWTLGYVLKTAGNWDGPIGIFHLILDGGGPGRALSLCLPGIELHRKGSARFEATVHNYVPRQDLAVVFFMPDDIRKTRSQ